MNPHSLARKSDLVVYVLQYLTFDGYRNSETYPPFQSRREARAIVNATKQLGRTGYRVARYEMTGAGK